MRGAYVLALFVALAGCDAASPIIERPPPAPEPLARTATVGLVADAQYCDCEPESERFYRASLWKLREASAAFNLEEVDFGVHLGDFIDRGVDSFGPALEATNGMAAPLLHVLGNHDFDVEAAARAGVPARLGLDARYYSRSQGLWRFIFLDGTDLSLYATAPGSARQNAARAMQDSLVALGDLAPDWGGGMGRTQVEWLRATLDDAFARGQRVAVFSHFPLVPSSAHSLWNAEEVLRVLDTYPNVVAHVSGHYHRGRFRSRNGVYHIGLEGMVMAPDENAFAVAHFGEEALELRGYGRVASRSLPYQNEPEVFALASGDR